jgi:mRNA interferase RelE/StbE
LEIVYHPKVSSEDLPRLAPEVVLRLRSAIEERLALHPEHFSLPLRAGLAGYRKMRVGDYRIIHYFKEDHLRIVIIGHRKDVYKRLSFRL